MNLKYICGYLYLTCLCRYLADTASDIIYRLGNYNLISSSCQTFCNKFLLNVTGKGYFTYTKKAGMSVSSLTYGAGILLIGGVLGFNPVGVVFCATAFTAAAITGILME